MALHLFNAIGTTRTALSRAKISLAQESSEGEPGGAIERKPTPEIVALTGRLETEEYALVSWPPCA